MKKVMRLVFLLLAVVVLVACQGGRASKLTNTNTESTSSTTSDTYGKAIILIKADTKDEKKEVALEKDDTVMDALKRAYEVKEKDGFITEIDGLSQDESKGIYWMFDVNGKLGDKMANQLTIKDGDEIKFYQQKY